MKSFRTQLISAQVHPQVVDWHKRVMDNGGADVSLQTLKAVNSFYVSLAQYGLTSKMLALNCYVPDSLIAATTPLIKTYGNDPWTNSGYAGGSLNVNGISNNGSFLDTGVVGTDFRSDTDAGLTCYATSVAGGTVGYYEMGYIANSNTSQSFLAFNATNQAVAAIWGVSGFASGPAQTNGGYLSGNIANDGFVNLYHGRVAVGHSKIASSSFASNSATRANCRIYVGCGHDCNGTTFGANPNRVSFAAIHDGLTQAESYQFYLSVYSLRLALGGGYV